MPKIIAATFANGEAAGRGLATIASALGGSLKQGAIVSKGSDGKIKLVEPRDMHGGQGAVTGGAIGAVVGILGGPLGVIAGGAIGAGVGGLAAKMRDSGFHDAQLKGLGEDLEPGAGAAVAIIEDDALDKAQELLKTVDAKRVVVDDISTDLANVLDQEAAAVAPTTEPTS